MVPSKRLDVILVFAALLLVVAACGAPGKSLVVFVQDHLTERPVQGAECRVGEDAARSDAAGQCRIARWSAGSTVKVLAAGYQGTEAGLSSLPLMEGTSSVTASVGLYPDRFDGQVLDDYTAGPVAGAQVISPRKTIAADGEGRFTVLTPTFPLSLTVQASGYETWQGSFLTTTARLALRPNTLTGVITSLDTGQPLAGAAVTVTGSSVLTATAGADGRYFLRGVPERGTLQVRAAQHRLAEIAFERTTTYDVPLRPAYLRGVVRDEAGQPVSQARVIVSGTYTHTDAAGNFFFPDVPETTVVQVLSPGFAKQVITVTDVPSLTVSLVPFRVQGLYVTAYVAGTPDWFDSLLDFVDRTELNAVVIEVKDAWGVVTYDSKVPLVQELRQQNAADSRWEVRYDVGEILRKAHERGIYVIAYIVTLEDSQLPTVRPEWAIQDAYGGLWADRKGLNWADPYRKEVWEYNVAVAKEVAALGFDEVQFDYIRFPTDGDLSRLVYSQDTSSLSQEQKVQLQYDTIAAFIQYAYGEIAPTGAFISADIFGYAAWRKMWEQGQDISLMTRYLDFICPMSYPSHYASGELGCANPAWCPYEIVLETMNRARAQLTEGQRARLRPWVQDFTLGGDPVYGPYEISEQIRGGNDGGGVGFSLWNAGNVYTEGVDYSP